MKKRKISFLTCLFLILLLTCNFALLFSEETFEQPTASNFASNFSSSVIQNISEKVNKSTGTVNFSVPISISNLSLNLTYSNNGVNEIVKKKNVFTPTSVLGLGWDLPKNSIVRFHNNTKTITDDIFYLKLNGQFIKLIYDGNNGDVLDYVAETDNTLRIQYNSNTNTDNWVVFSGMQKMIFGENDDSNHPFSSKAKTICIGNWIGNSIISKDENGVNCQSNFTTEWFLTTVTDQFDNAIHYTYNQAIEKVGFGDVPYTQAVYLNSIFNDYGYSINLNYEDKEIYEYADPHTEMTEPEIRTVNGIATNFYDGYQEQYEKKYLLSIYLKKDDGILTEIDFDYKENNLISFINTDNNFKKRLLRGIQILNKENELQSYTKYSYYESDDASDQNNIIKHKGFIQTIQTEKGANVTYSYEKKTIGNNYHSIFNPGQGYKSPKVFSHNNYVVTTWRQTDTNNILVMAKYWVGNCWKSMENPVTIDNVVNYYSTNSGGQLPDDFEIVMENDFFAIINRTYHDSNLPRQLVVINWNNNLKNWENPINYSLPFSASNTESTISMCSGDRYIAVAGRESGFLYLYVKNYNSTWSEATSQDYGLPGLDNEAILNFTLNGLNNYFLFKQKNDALSLFYLNQNLDWETKSFLNPSDYQTNLQNNQNSDSQWKLNSTSSVVLRQGYSECFYAWDEFFNTFTRFLGSATDNGLGGVNDLYSISNNDNTWGLRWNGVSIKSKIDFYKGETNSYLGDDLIIRRNFIPDGSLNFWIYDVNIDNWRNCFEDDELCLPHRIELKGNLAAVLYKENSSSNDNRIKIYKKNSSWSTLYTLNSNYDIDYLSFKTGLDFLIYTENQNHRLKILNEKDELISVTLPESYNTKSIVNSDLYSFWLSNCFVTSLKDATIIDIFRVNNEMQSNIASFPVNSISINTGAQTLETCFEYSDSYFLNNSINFGTMTTMNKANNCTLGKNVQTSCRTYNDDVRYWGLPWTVFVYDSENNYLQHTLTNYDIIPTYNVQDDRTYKIIKTSEFAYKKPNQILVSETHYSYDESTGTNNKYKRGRLLTEENSCINEKRKEYKYFDEIYTPYVAFPAFNPIIGTVSKIEDVIVSASANTFLPLDGNKWVQSKTYQWDGITPYQNFTWWNDSEPDDNSGWIKTSEITQIDAKGRVIESQDMFNTPSMVKFGYNDAIPVLSGANCKYNEVFYQNYEEVNKNNAWYSTKTNQSVSQEESYTGKNSLKLVSTNSNTAQSYLICKELLIDVNYNENSKILFSAFVKADSFDDLHIQLKYWLDSDEDGSEDDGEWKYPPCVYYTNENSGKWKKLEVLLDLTTIDQHQLIKKIIAIGRHQGSNSKISYWDDILVQPVESSITTTAYDPITLQKTFETDDSGNTICYEYDRFSKLSVIHSKENTLMTGKDYHISKQENYRSFTDPNINYSFASQYGFFEGFDNFNSINKWTTLSGNWSINSSCLKQSEIQNTNAKIYTQIDQTNNMVYSWEQKALSGSNCGLHIMASNTGSNMGNSYLIWTNGSKVLFYVSNNNSLTLKKQSESLDNVNGRWTVIYYNKQISVYINGKRSLFVDLVQDGLPVYNTGTYVAFRANNTIVNFKSLAVYNNPSASVVYSDYLDRELQKQTLDKGGIIVAQTIYDAWGRPSVTTLPGLYENEHFNLKQNYANFNFLTDTMSGDILTKVSDDYPYSQVKYERSPLSRKIEEGSPGAVNAIKSSGSHSVKYFYDLDPSPYMTSCNYSNASCSKTVDPNGISVVQIKDNEGKLLYTIADADAVNGIEKNITGYAYDSKGNCTQIFNPNYYNPPSGMESLDYIITNTYNGAGRKISTNSTNIGSQRSFYSKKGRLIFSQDQKGIDQGYYNYVSYDQLGRVIESGYKYGLWLNFNDPEDNDMGSQPEDRNAGIWRIRKYYDTNGTICGLRGGLYEVQTNNDEDPESEVIEKFKYNKKGDIIQKTEKILSFDDNFSFVTKYDYDVAGNVIKIDYPNYTIKENLILDNASLTNECYYATNSITAGSPTNNVTLSADNVLFKSENEITLSPGFVAPSGTNFMAEIGDILVKEAKIVTYSYDNYGRLKAIGKADEEKYYAEYNYDINGQIIQEKLSVKLNPISVGYTYNISGHLQDLSTPNDIFLEHIVYEPNGNISQLNFKDYTYNFSYNNLGRLTSADNDNNNDFDYSGITYDANGNFLTLAKGNSLKTYVYNSGTDQVKNTSGSSINDYQYDLNGNVNVSTPKSMTIDYDKYTGSTISISLQVNNENPEYIYYSYNSSGERVMKQANLQGGILKTAYLRGLGDYPIFEVDESGNVLNYIYSPTGLICKIKNNDEFYVIKDHQGSTRKVISAGVVVTSYYYDAFGNIMESSISEDISYQYTGQEFDEETGLHNFRARLYDSELMRFYAVDPQGQTPSPYLFCGNSPVMYTDPDGEFFIAAAMLVKIAITLAAVNAVYSGYQTAKAYDNPAAFLIGFNQASIATGFGVVTGDPTGTTSSFILNKLDFGNDISSGIGPFSYNWSKDSFNIANPFDDDNVLENINDAYSWIFFASQISDAIDASKVVAIEDKKYLEPIKNAKEKGDSKMEERLLKEQSEMHDELGHRTFGRIMRDPLIISIIDPLRELYQLFLYGGQEVAHNNGLRKANPEYYPISRRNEYMPDAVHDSWITIVASVKYGHYHPNSYNPYLWWYKKSWRM